MKLIYTVGVGDSRAPLSFIAFATPEAARGLIRLLNERNKKIFDKRKHLIAYPIYSSQEIKLYDSLEEYTQK